MTRNAAGENFCPCDKSIMFIVRESVWHDSYNSTTQQQYNPRIQFSPEQIQINLEELMWLSLCYYLDGHIHQRDRDWDWIGDENLSIESFQNIYMSIYQGMYINYYRFGFFSPSFFLSSRLLLFERLQLNDVNIFCCFHCRVRK